MSNYLTNSPELWLRFLVFCYHLLYKIKPHVSEFSLIKQILFKKKEKEKKRKKGKNREDKVTRVRERLKRVGCELVGQEDLIFIIKTQILRVPLDYLSTYFHSTLQLTRTSTCSDSWVRSNLALTTSTLPILDLREFGSIRIQLSFM